VSAADTAYDAALSANTHREPIAATSTPPTTGPSVRPVFRPIATRLFAHERCSFPAMFGIAAPDAGK
jgi:hypothetical protein